MLCMIFQFHYRHNVITWTDFICPPITQVRILSDFATYTQKCEKNFLVRSAANEKYGTFVPFHEHKLRKDWVGFYICWLCIKIFYNTLIPDSWLFFHLDSGYDHRGLLGHLSWPSTINLGFLKKKMLGGGECYFLMRRIMLGGWWR